MTVSYSVFTPKLLEKKQILVRLCNHVAVHNVCMFCICFKFLCCIARLHRVCCILRINLLQQNEKCQRYESLRLCLLRITVQTWVLSDLPELLSISSGWGGPVRGGIFDLSILSDENPISIHNLNRTRTATFGNAQPLVYLITWSACLILLQFLLGS